MTWETASSVLTEQARAALARMARERAERAKKDGGNWKGDEGAASHANAKRARGEASTAKSKTSLPQRIDDFVAYMPGHLTIYTLTGEMWPAASVNARIPPVHLVDDGDTAILNDKGEPQYLAANAWLDRNRAAEQMTWAPGRADVNHWPPCF